MENFLNYYSSILHSYIEKTLLYVLVYNAYIGSIFLGLHSKFIENSNI